jgi:predicted AAA+ superfamily ATPase
MKIIPRHLTPIVERSLGVSRVINLVGPRQAGKTTLVRDLIKTARYLTLDDDGLRAAFEADPYGQLQLLSIESQKSSHPIVIDEVQRLPQITLALKRIVDADRRPGQFVLTGSSDIFATGQAYDSLAGRVMTLTLRPLSAAEITGNAPCQILDIAGEGADECLSAMPRPVAFSRSKAIDQIVRGGFPEIRNLDDRDRIHRYMSYLDSIIERDLAPIATVRKPDTLRRLIDQLAARTAEEINIAELCKVLGSRKETVNEYMDILSRLGIVHRLGAWTSSGAKREIKAAKLHFLDTGCATALRAEDSGSFGVGVDPVALGHLIESFVFIELEKSLPHLAKRWRLYHWRHDNREIDIIAEAPGKRLALFEMKAAASVSTEDFRHINWFRTEGPGKSYKSIGFLVYLGDEILLFGEGKIALPLSMLWSFRSSS